MPGSMRLIPVIAGGLLLASTTVHGTEVPGSATGGPAAAPVTIVCVSTATDRVHCPADTSAGVAILRSTGVAACLLG
jgi:hypothetical protein